MQNKPQMTLISSDEIASFEEAETIDCLIPEGMRPAGIENNDEFSKAYSDLKAV